MTECLDELGKASLNVLWMVPLWLFCPCVLPFCPKPIGWSRYFLFFTKEQTKAQRGEVTIFLESPWERLQKNLPASWEVAPKCPCPSAPTLLLPQVRWGPALILSRSSICGLIPIQGPYSYLWPYFLPVASFLISLKSYCSQGCHFHMPDRPGQRCLGHQTESLASFVAQQAIL